MILTQNCLGVGAIDCISILMTRQKSGNLVSSGSINLSYFPSGVNKCLKLILCGSYSRLNRTSIFWWKTVFVWALVVVTAGLVTVYYLYGIC